MNRIFKLGKDQLTVSIALAIADNVVQVEVDRPCKEKLMASAHCVERIAQGTKSVYGINTGFGPLCTTTISSSATTTLQKKLLMSHSVGVGDPISVKTAKLMLILKLHALCQGYSGVSLQIIDRMLWHLKEDLIPLVPSQGSVGASGDLAPLSHLFLPLIGEGKIYDNGQYRPTSSVLVEHGLKPIVLGPKDGLALINGTQFIAAHGVEMVHTFYRNLAHADLIGAMMIEGLLGSKMPFHHDLHQLRPFPGNIHTASRIWKFLQGSKINESHIQCTKVQDPYSLRCMPQVHGSSRSAWLHLKQALEVEMASVTDNPVIFDENHTISGGNFHGQPLALPIDYACLANAELGNISDRRIYLSLEGNTQNVPKLLMKETGLNSGFMILQYTSAALASENKTHCFPASADSIVTSLGQEDHVSMGSIGARKALKVIRNTEKILAIELICASQAIDFHRPLLSSPILESIHESLRAKISFATEDRIFSEDINASIDLLQSGQLLKIEKTHKNVEYSPYDNLFEVY